MSSLEIDRKPTLAEMAIYLANHEMYRHRHQESRFSWNIKVHSADDMGKSNPDYPVQPKWDTKWAAYISSNPEIFGQCCEDGMRSFFEFVHDGHYFTGVADDHPLAGMKSCKFYAAGRSGGHLIMEELDGIKVDSTIDWLEQVEEDPSWLQMVYAACVDVDKFDANKEMSYQYGFYRHNVEETWDEEVQQAEQEKKDLKLVGTFIYLMAHPDKHSAIIDAAERLSLPTTPDGEPNYDT